MEIVKQNVHQAATVVNQTILLCRLYETKTCDPLLEPIIEDHDHSDDAGIVIYHKLLQNSITSTYRYII